MSHATKRSVSTPKEFSQFSDLFENNGANRSEFNEISDQRSLEEISSAYESQKRNVSLPIATAEDLQTSVNENPSMHNERLPTQNSQINAFKHQNEAHANRFKSETKSIEFRQRNQLTRKSDFVENSHARRSVTFDCFNAKSGLPWFHWFYPFLEASFFAQNEFIECLHKAQYRNLERATRHKWSCIRASMGHPRRLSNRFLRQEREKLEAFRESQFEHFVETFSQRDGMEKFSLEGRKALVALPVESHVELKAARIVSFDSKRCMFKVFLEKECRHMDVNLDRVMVPECRMGREEMMDPKRSSHSLELSSKRLQMIQSISLVRKLLERKEHLLSGYSLLTRRNVSDGNMTEQSKWIEANLDITNQYLNAALLSLQESHPHQMSPNLQLHSSLATSNVWNRELVRMAVANGHKMIERVEKSNCDFVSNSVTQDTKEMIAGCTALVAFIRTKEYEKSIPSTLLENILQELLKIIRPRHSENIDVYNEIKASLEEMVLS